MSLKDNKIFRLIIIPVCIFLCFFAKFLPNDIFPLASINVAGVTYGLTRDGLNVLLIFLGCLILWLTIGIDWPSLLCIFALCFLDSFNVSDKDALRANSIFANSFGNSTFVFLLFTFMCTYALSKTSLIKRISLAFINNKFAKKHGYWFIVLFLSAVLLLGLFISPSVLFVAVLPILNEILELAKINKEDKVGKVLMLGLGFTVSISSGMTTIAHIFPINAINAANLNVSPLQYMLVGIPTGLVLFAVMNLIFAFVLHFGKDCKSITNVDVSSIKDKLEKIKSSDIVTLSIFILVILLWVLPSLFKESAPQFYEAINKYGTAVPPLLGTLLLCIIRIDNKPLLSISDAMKNGIPWPGMMMCASTLVLGVALTNNNVGLKTWLQYGLQGSIGGLPLFVLLLIFTLWAALQTNVSSNMVTATLVATVASAILTSIPNISNATIVSIICIIGMLASFAFATPPSMPHIAIVASSDYCSTKDTLIYGGILMFASVVVCLLVAYPLGLLIF